MGEFLSQVPENIQGHIKEITKTSGLTNNEESIEKMAEVWLEKKKAFEENILNNEMEYIDCLEKEDDRAAIAMTYSGSLITIGPLVDGKRKVSYASIGLRQDVPDLVTNDDSVLSDNVMVDEAIRFDVGPVKKTSQIYKIIVCMQPLSADEQQDKITEVATVIIDDFIEVNKTLIDQ